MHYLFRNFYALCVSLYLYFSIDQFKNPLVIVALNQFLDVPMNFDSIVNVTNIVVDEVVDFVSNINYTAVLEEIRITSGNIFKTIWDNIYSPIAFTYVETDEDSTTQPFFNYYFYLSRLQRIANVFGYRFFGHNFNQFAIYLDIVE